MALAAPFSAVPTCKTLTDPRGLCYSRTLFSNLCPKIWFTDSAAVRSFQNFSPFSAVDVRLSHTFVALSLPVCFVYKPCSSEEFFRSFHLSQQYLHVRLS